MNGCANFQPGAPRPTSMEKGVVRPVERHLPPLQQEIRDLSQHCTQGLFAFLLISTGFFSIRHVDLLGSLSAPTRELLGCPPPQTLTTLLLAIYIFSQVVLTLGRTASGARPLLKWHHLAYRSVFYFFYATANALGDHFLAVFVAGLFLVGLDFLNLWAYSVRNLFRSGEMTGKF